MLFRKSGHKHFSAGNERVENTCSNLSHTYTHSWLPATFKQNLCWDDYLWNGHKQSRFNCNTTKISGVSAPFLCIIRQQRHVTWKLSTEKWLSRYDMNVFQGLTRTVSCPPCLSTNPKPMSWSLVRNSHLKTKEKQEKRRSNALKC